MAQHFYDYRILHRSNDITALRPYLSDKLATLLSDASRDNNHRNYYDNPFSSRTTLPESAVLPVPQQSRIVMREIFLCVWI